MLNVRARAPVRIDFAGGWTDVALFARTTPGAVVNATISMYSYATVSRQEEALPAASPGIRRNGNLTIYSADFDIFIQAEDIKKLEYDGQIDLIKAAVRRMELPSGFDITTRSNAPAGSGLGTSATMGVATLAALAQISAKHMLPHEVAELASDIERTELKIRGGKQDHYASALGGFSFMEFFGEEVRFANLPISSDVRLELQKDLVLCYTGKSRLSGDIHAHVVRAFEAGERATCDAIDRLKQIAHEMKGALMAGDVRRFAELLSENWENQKRLHSSVTNKQIEKLFEIASDAGAIGGKACGAGGGGCLLFCAAPGREHLVRKALENAGAAVIDFDFTQQGLETWRT
jgi:D-glycero-alpha-D-manno-heptose-7-phosphate kinase